MCAFIALLSGLLKKTISYNSIETLRCSDQKENLDFKLMIVYKALHSTASHHTALVFEPGRLLRSIDSSLFGK